MAKRHRWRLRIAFEIDGGLTTANKALEEMDAIKRAVEEAGYLVLDYRGTCGPMDSGPGDET